MRDCAVVVADAEGVIRFWNEGATAAFGHAASDAVGRTLDLIVPGEYRAAHWAGFQRALRSGRASAEGNPGPFPVLHADGRITPLEGRLTLIRQGAGRVVGAVVVFG